MAPCWLLLAALAALPALAALAALADVSVVTLQLALEEEHTLQVDNTVEYILQFVPSVEQSQFPSRVRVRSAGGDAAHPLLVTARQRSGAITWQLPYYSGEDLLFELERTLCPDDTADAGSSDCTDEAELARRGEFSLHVASACAKPFTVSLRAAAARDWLVAPPAHAQPLHTQLSQVAPRVHYYMFEGEQDSVRLVVESEDDVCATIAVQQYTCPITQTLDDIEGTTVRMTVQRSGGMQLSRVRYPRGFYVIAVTGDSDEPCTGEPPDPAAEPDWLWEAAVWPAAAPGGSAPRQEDQRRLKRLALHTKESLSRAQYVVGTMVTLAVFVGFYLVFGALVLAERWPRWRALVAPRAVLAEREPAGPAELEAAPDAARARRRRRGSDATFDSSDNSDSDSAESDEGGTTTTAAATPPPASPPAPAGGEQGAGGAPRPFGLPARLHVAALARRRGRVLRARSDRYLYTLYTVAVFYALPVVQFVAAFQLFLNVSGSLDLCYHNFLCAHPLGALSDFNHVYSNLGYLLLGALFMLQLRRRRRRRKRQPRHEEYGIPQHYGLLSSLGAAMMVVALLSASYHVCPNRLNFQFDTAFMYVLSVLCMVKIYQSRHPDINARAHATFGVLAALIALVVWGVLGGGALFWAIFTVLHVFTFLLLSLRIYYVGQFRLEGEPGGDGAGAARGLGAAAVHAAPRGAARRQRRQLGLRALRAGDAVVELRVAPAVRAAVQHAAVHRVLPEHETAARRAAALVQLGVPGGRGGGLGAGALPVHVGLHGLGGDSGGLAPRQPRVPRAGLLRLARPVARAVRGRALPHLQRHPHVGRRPLRRPADRHRRLLNTSPATRPRLTLTCMCTRPYRTRTATRSTFRNALGIRFR